MPPLKQVRLGWRYSTSLCQCSPHSPTLHQTLVWPSADNAKRTVGPPLSRHGFDILLWTNSGINYWAISGLNLSELREFAQALQQ
jgi:hypothetical protein